MKMKEYEVKSAYTQKVQYGKSESRRAIANVLEAVLNKYKFTTLPELNAVLQQYNVFADRGRESSRVYQHHGLLYRILNEQGNNIGVPIKASSFHSKPTLTSLKERFALNEAARLPYRGRIKNVIDLALLRQPELSLQNLMKELEKQGINAILRKNAEGIIYGITYIDHQTKCVFNGSDLGQKLSAKAIIERCKESVQEKIYKHSFDKDKEATSGQEPAVYQSSENENNESLLDVLLKPEYTSAYVPYQLTANGKKKKKKSISKRL